MPALLSESTQIASGAIEISNTVKNHRANMDRERLRGALAEIDEQLIAPNEWNRKANRELKFNVLNYSELRRYMQRLDFSVATVGKSISRLGASLQLNGYVRSTATAPLILVPYPESQKEIDDWKYLGQELLRKVLDAETAISEASDTLKTQ